MLPLKNVVVVLDPEQEGQPALRKVLSLAKLADFNTHLIACEYSQFLVEGYYFDAAELPALRQELLDARKAALEDLAAPLRAAGLKVRTRAIWGHPAYQYVIRAATSLKADLVIQHTRQHGAISRMLLTHDDWQLVRCCPMPLLLVKQAPWQGSLTVIAAVDPKHARDKPAELDRKIVAMAQDLVNLAGGAAHVIHSYSQPPLSGTYPKQAHQAHEAAMAQLMADFEIPESQQHLTMEAPEFAIAALQGELSADIVIMGAISRSILSDVFVGNTAEKVLDSLDCDALIVKPDGFETPVRV